MNDHANRGRGDFSQRINQVRREAEQLLRQVREIQEQMGGLWGPSGRPAVAAPGSSDRPRARGEGLYRPAGFPYQFETLGRSFAELEAWTQKIAGRDEELNKSLRDLEVRSEEIAGVAASLGETLGVKTASLARLGVLVREIAAGRRILKRDQEELSGAVNETISLLEQREQGRRLLFDLAKTTLIQGEKKRDHLEEILTNQKALAEHLEDCGKWLERTLVLYEGGQAGFTKVSGCLWERSTEFQELVEELNRFHDGLQGLEKLNPDSYLQEMAGAIRALGQGVDKRRETGAVPQEVPEAQTGPAPLTPELAGLLDTVNSLNEQMNLLSLNAFIASVQGGRKPEELAEVFGDIRVISDRLKMEVHQYREKNPREDLPAGGASGSEKAPGPEEEEALLRELESLRPAFRQVGQVVHDLGGAADRLLDHLRRIGGQFQELALQVREQTRFAGRLLEGLLPLKNSLGQLQRVQADQDIQLQEVSRSLQRTLSQAAPVRKWFSESGPGAGAPLARAESVREITRTLAGELFKQGQDEERLQQELDRLRSLPEAVEQFAVGQNRKQLEFQEAVEKVRGDFLRMTRDLAAQQVNLKTVIGQVSRLYENLEPFLRDSREQSVMNRALLDAFTEIRERIQEKGTG